jgi:catecholate siderophore receptor
MKPFKSKPVYFAVLMALTALPLTGKSAESTGGTASEDEDAVLPEISVSSEREASPPFRADKSSTVTKIPTPLRDIPQSISVVTEELIESQRAFNLRDALRNVSGLTIAAGEGGRTGDSITLRGFAANSDIYLDGVKDNGQYNRDTFFLERVEVLKGPSSILFGRGSTGGVINQVSKQADGETHMEAVITGGSYDFRRGTFDVGTAVTDNVSVRLNALYQETNSFRDNNFLDRKGLAPSIRFDFSENTALTLNYLYQEEDSVYDYGVPMFRGRPASVPRSRFYGWEDDLFQNYETNVASAVFTHSFSEDFSVRNTLRYGDYERDYRTMLPNQINQSTATVRYAQSLRNSGQQNLFNQTDFILKKPLFGMANTLAFGTEFGKEDFDFKSTPNVNGTPTSIFNPVFPSTLGVARPDDFSNLSSNRQVNTYTRAAYFLDQLELMPQWKLQLGLRYDDFSADVDNRFNGDQFSTRDYQLSPRAGLVWQPSDAESYYVSYGTSFNPSAEAFSLNAETTEVEPEKNRNYELGGKWELFNGRMTLTSAVFRLEKFNARTDAPNDPTLTVLSGEQRTNGFELEVAGEIKPGWNVSTAYAYLDSEVTKSNSVADGSVSGVEDISLAGMTLQNVPKHSGAIWTTYRFLENWEIGGGVFFASSRYTDTVEEVKLPGYARIDAVLAYHQPNYDIQLNLYNLADKRYFESGQTRTAMPGVPFSGQLTLAVHF